MKTAIILLVVVAAGLCNAHTDSSKNTTKVLNNGPCYKSKDCTGPSRPSVNAAECCNVYKGCSYFEPDNGQCYFCDIPSCSTQSGYKYKCFRNSDCTDYLRSVSESYECCDVGDTGCSYSDGRTCYKCNTAKCANPSGGDCFRSSDCSTGFFRHSVNAAECCNVYRGCSYYEPSNRQCYFCDIPGCHNKN